MDVSTSCYSIHAQGPASPTPDEKYFQICASSKSLSSYEKRSFKTLLPQISAAIVVSLLRISTGISLAYSAILLPQLKEHSEIKMTASQASWTASIIALTTPAGSILVGLLMDRFGRLHTLAMAGIPGILGCITIALSNNVGMMIAGRALVGFSTGFGGSPAIVYMTEIARKDMRGSLISFIPTFTSFGMILTFAMGWFINWRQVAWYTNIFIVIPCVLVFFIPESPAWLVSKGRIEEAKQSLVWIHKYQPQPEGRTQSLAELQLAALQKEHELKMIELSKKDGNDLQMQMRELMKPTGYKPMLILCGVFVFQQFSGIFTFYFYSITFFQEVGSTVNPYLSSILISFVRFAMSITNTFVLKSFRRRPLVMLSAVGMAASIFSSGICTHWIQNGTTTMTWVPVLFLVLFVVTSMMGLVNIPYSMTAELFPLEIRGVSQSVSSCIASFLMFLSLQSYPYLYQFLGGMVGLQFFFGSVILVGLVFVYVFLPETHQKKLSEIEQYFRHNMVFIGQKKREARRVERVPSRIVKCQQDQEKGLLENRV